MRRIVPLKMGDSLGKDRGARFIVLLPVFSGSLRRPMEHVLFHGTVAAENPHQRRHFAQVPKRVCQRRILRVP
jgi:hypothetical protein